jgi:hypothetical protein
MHCYTITDDAPPPLWEEVEGGPSKKAMIYNIVAKLISDPEWQQKEKDH